MNMKSGFSITKSSEALAWMKCKPSGDLFFEWNLRLLRCFFSEASRGEEVFLRVDRDFFNQVGQDIGGDSGFLNAVRKGPSSVKEHCSLVKKATELLAQRTSTSISAFISYEDPEDLDSTYRGFKAPTYLPYLAALVRNFSEIGTGGYYQNFIEELNLTNKFNSVDMHELEKLWEDLKEWSESCDGKFGFFHKRRLGGYKKIGVPASQSIVKQHDLERLPHCFFQLQLKTGQELSEDKLEEIIGYAKGCENLFSTGFNQALDDSEFERPIREIVRYAYSDWDGSIPRKSADNSSSEGAYERGDNLELGISLVVASQHQLTLSPRWFLPALQDSGYFELECLGFFWTGKFWGTEGISCREQGSQDNIIWQIAAKAARDIQPFNLKYSSTDDLEPLRLSLSLPLTPLWVLVPSNDNINGLLELKPSSLPANGPAYLLAPPKSTESLRQYVVREQPVSEFIEADGIPDDWKLLCLMDCSGLSDAQRLLPDGRSQVHSKPNPIRFVGGRSVQRGYTRMYLPYDLPIIELDAPDDSCLLGSGGINFSEEQPSFSLSPKNAFNDKYLKLKRRFHIRIPSAKSANYDIQVTDSKGNQLGRARLKVTGLSGDVVQISGDFCLDRFGKAQVSRDGMIGALLTGQIYEEKIESEPEHFFSLDAAVLQERATFNLENSCIYRKFLDRLVQSGSLAYGEAKNLLMRLIQSNDSDLEPIFALFELRRRGYIELSTTNKGNTARVHAVAPTLYSLPVMCSGSSVWGVAGTLRLEHWQLIAAEQDAWHAYGGNNESLENGSWRLVIQDSEKALEISSRLGFQFAAVPATKISNWSGDLEGFKAQVGKNTMESIGNSEDEAMRFIAIEGYFKKNPTGKLSDIWELWKLQDLDVRFDKIHVLANESHYAFVRDSAWAKWLAINEVAKKYSKTHPEIYPPPINYDSRSGTVWIPARVGLPVVLERALVLCNGCSPEVIYLQQKKDMVGENRVLLVNSLTGALVLSSNIFYAQMAQGRWLAYPNVPEQVARVIAQKLGAALDIG
ncbi:hypothetical protein [Shewanella sp. NIFS-20-20]|uniref:hypothetical protein n=1 Tax=Shewanella sp. NIFS-20-20 TaxID=2853806 RepID=UPI001C43B019|nr:hypothetical protein [Shewanella sp. NIFS-20-20]MBV7315427.1 hypothetical protein [Shewanella sp. NIFS-20-20]